jgi:zinc D-Ala-D-Ala carboxypeptidase
MNLSKTLTLAEAIFSETAVRKGIDNSPTAEHLENLKYLGLALDKIEAAFPDLKYNSVYRSKKLNTAIGGSLSSFHSKGCAADFNCSNKANLFHWIKNNIPFTELIWEFGDNNQPAWVHFAIVKGRENERELLRAVSENKRTKYLPFK